MNVDPAPAREYVRKFRDIGMSWKTIADLTGVTHTQLKELAQGRTTKIRRDNAEKILNTRLPASRYEVAVNNDLVPAIGATRRLQALMANGWAQTYLAERLGITNSRISELVHSQRECVTAERYHAIRQLFDELQLSLGTCTYARNLGIKHGWALPLEWDEELIDDPAAEPVRARRRKKDDVLGPKLERIEKVRELTAKGLTTRQIADQLKVTPRQIVRDRSAA
ncbi:hypothetical protein K3M35_05285 [Rhodococcus sp. DMU2021]|uniref:hypothetical protein n=1 Tax=Rhodococcus sp. DMU2021 TaxID=2866997 RepID=UPI001C7D403A|nr:hypothetical protein [Rhodococcus sp. DMU2021]MBX4168080.1 hypothetical protein [Rhodococcus sp. DMU2021]